MKRIERYYFILPPEGRKKYPGAIPDMSSKVVLLVPETPEEIAREGLGHGSGLGRQPSHSE